MSNDPRTDLVEAYLADKRLEVASDYVRRGRSLQSLTDDDLNRDWLSAFRAWAMSAQARSKFDRRPLDDMESEMCVRGYDPPYNLVETEITTLVEASRQTHDQLLRAPEAMNRVARDFGDDLAAFAHRLSSTTKN